MIMIVLNEKQQEYYKAALGYMRFQDEDSSLPNYDEFEDRFLDSCDEAWNALDDTEKYITSICINASKEYRARPEVAKHGWLGFDESDGYLKLSDNDALIVALELDHKRIIIDMESNGIDGMGERRRAAMSLLFQIRCDDVDLVNSFSAIAHKRGVTNGRVNKRV